jgi:hypothetical protein
MIPPSKSNTPIADARVNQKNRRTVADKPVKIFARSPSADAALEAENSVVVTHHPRRHTARDTGLPISSNILILYRILIPKTARTHVWIAPQYADPNSQKPSPPYLSAQVETFMTLI